MTSRSTRLYLCDAPTLILEDLLPFFRELGYDCTYYPDPMEMRADEPEPDAVLFCAEAPGGPGGEGFRHVRHIFPGAPVVAVAQSRSFSSAVAYFRAGAADYLPVPLDPDGTRRRIETLLRETAGAGPCDPVEVTATFVDETFPHPPAEDLLDLETFPCGVLLLDDAGILLRANRAALDSLACEDEDALRLALKRRLAALHPVNADGCPLARLPWPRDGQSVLWGLTPPGGALRWLHLTARAAGDPPGTDQVVALADVTAILERAPAKRPSTRILPANFPCWRPAMRYSKETPDSPIQEFPMDAAFGDTLDSFLQAARNATECRADGRQAEEEELLEFLDGLWDRMTPAERGKAEVALRENGLDALAGHIRKEREEL